MTIKKDRKFLYPNKGNISCISWEVANYGNGVDMWIKLTDGNAQFYMSIYKEINKKSPSLSSTLIPFDNLINSLEDARQAFLDTIDKVEVESVLGNKAEVDDLIDFAPWEEKPKKDSKKKKATKKKE